MRKEARNTGGREHKELGLTARLEPGPAFNHPERLQKQVRVKAKLTFTVGFAAILGVASASAILKGAGTMVKYLKGSVIRHEGV